MLAGVGKEIGVDDKLEETIQHTGPACAPSVFRQHGEHMEWKSAPMHLLTKTQQEDSDRAFELEGDEPLPMQFTVFYLPRFVDCQHHVRVVDLADIKLCFSNGHNKAVEISEKQRPPLVLSRSVKISRW